MKFKHFSPKPCPGVRPIATYSAYQDTATKKAVRAFEDALTGKSTVEHQQSAWMGRGSFCRIGSHSYLMGKGIGPGPGSEDMRILLDSLWKERAGYLKGGCIRLESDRYYPLLLQYRQVDKHNWEVSDPRPEGFSIFGAVLREAEAGEIYARLGIDVVSPVSIYRNNTTPTWTQSKTGLTRFIQKSFSSYVSEQEKKPTKPGDVQVINLVESGYWEYDGGILLRHAKTPYRIINLHFAVIDNNKKLLKELVTHTRKTLRSLVLDKRSSSRGRKTDEILVERLGRLSGAMHAYGIVHGLLNIHYQNISVVGELADLDASIFLPSFFSESKKIPDFNLSSAEKKLFSGYMKAIYSHEETHSISMAPFVYTDLKTYTGAKPSQQSLDPSRTAMYLLGQVYDIYNHALKAYDLIGRAALNDIQKPGTVLSKSEVQQVRSIFIGSMIAELKKHNALDMLSWSLDHGKQKLLSSYFKPKAKTSIYGWHKPHTHINHLLIPYDDERVDFVQSDANDLLSEIEEAILRVCPK